MIPSPDWRTLLPLACGGQRSARNARITQSSSPPRLFRRSAGEEAAFIVMQPELIVRQSA